MTLLTMRLQIQRFFRLNVSTLETFQAKLLGLQDLIDNWVLFALFCYSPFLSDNFLN